MDPIYFCQMLTACRFNDIGDAKITKAEITPKSGPRGNVHVLPSSVNTLLLLVNSLVKGNSINQKVIRKLVWL